MHEAAEEHVPVNRMSRPSTFEEFVPQSLKRPSFLPQPGDSKPRTRAAAPAEDPTQLQKQKPQPRNLKVAFESSRESHTQPSARVPGASEGRLRPRSMYQTSSTPSDSVSQRTTSTNSSTRQSADQAKNTAPAAGIQRSRSLRKPGGPTPPTAVQNTRGHSRTVSTNATSTISQERGARRTQLDRPKSLVIPSSNFAKEGGPATTETGASAIRSSQRLAALKGPTGVSSKPERPSSSNSATTAESDSQKPLAGARRREVGKEEVRKQIRPAFSTFQQHYTPKKTTKAPTSTFLHPPAPEAASWALPPEIISLQTELLQLSILHESSVEVDKKWRQSAKRTLHKKFDEIASLYQVMRDSERRVTEGVNIKALREWSSGNSSFGMTENIQLLSGPLHELPSLVDAGGRFSRLVYEFEEWMAWVEEIWTARETNSMAGSSKSGYAEGLGDSWKAENAALTRKLTAFSRDLDRLSQPRPGSSIESIVSACKRLTDGLLDELDTMQAMESGVVAKEREWVEAELTAIAQDIGARLETNDDKEIWRM